MEGLIIYYEYIISFEGEKKKTHSSLGHTHFRIKIRIWIRILEVSISAIRRL